MWEDGPLELERDLIKKTCYVSLIPLLLTLLSGQLSSFLGLVVGLIISFLMFRLKRLNITRALNMGQSRAITFIRNRYLISYLLYFAVLFVAYRNSNLNFIATAIGLLLLKYTIIGMAFIDAIKESWHKKIKSYEERRNLNESRT